MIEDEFIPGEGVVRHIDGKYGSERDDKGVLLSDVFGPHEELLYKLSADVSLRCAEHDARQSIMTLDGMRLMCRVLLEREPSDGAMIAVGADDNGIDVTTLFSGRMPAEARLLCRAQELFDRGNHRRWIVAHSFKDSSGASDCEYANKLFQLAAEKELYLEDYLVFRGADCYSLKDEYSDFWI